MNDDIEFEPDPEGAVLLHLHCAKMMRRSLDLHLAVGFPRDNPHVQRLQQWHDDAIEQANDWSSRQ